MLFLEILRHRRGSVLQLAPCSDLWQLRSAAGSRAAAAYTTPQMYSAANTLGDDHKNDWKRKWKTSSNALGGSNM